MRIVTLIALVVVGPVRADEATNILDRAIRVQAGSLEKLDALRSMSAKMDGTFTSNAGDLPASRDFRTAGPDKFHNVIEMTFGGRSTSMTMVGNGNNGWEKSDGGTSKMTALRLSECRDEMYVWSLMTLLPLKEDGVKLVLLPPTKVNGQEAVGFRADQRFRPSVDMYFDKQSGLLVKTRFDSTEGGTKMSKEAIYSDHKAFGGITLPTTFKEERGALKSSWTKADYKIGGEFDPKIFKEP